jgi:hypothetical protein
MENAFLKQVADAIYEEFENRPLYAQAQMNGVLAEELARAAIKAMREPTEAMLFAGFRNNRWKNPNPCGPRCVGAITRPTDDIWRAMVDAALDPPAVPTIPISAYVTGDDQEVKAL